MPLPVGTWNIVVNGKPDTLIVSSTGSTFAGTLSGLPITGFFDETDQRFSFLQINQGDASAFTSFAGTLFAFSPAAATIVHILAGTFTGYPTPAGPVGVLGWSAQMSQKIKEKDGKDGKDKEQAKDTKDFKDRKDNKETGKDGKDGKEHGKELEKHLETLPQAALGGHDPLVDQLALRLSAVEQQLAVGQSFITPAERPAVGPTVSDDKPS